jgi:hypothetical protein
MVKLIEKGTPRIKDKDFDANYAKAAEGMSREQLIEAYRALPRNDPFRDFIRDKLVEKVAPPEMTKGQSFVAGATDMMSLGLSDEINGLLAKLGASGDSFSFNGSGSYEGEVGAQREMQRRAQADNPMTYMGGQAAGAIPMVLASAATLPAATTLPGMAGMAAAEGAAQGAVYGGASGEGLSDRLWQAIEQAGIGAATGAVGPYAGRALGATWRTARDAVKNNSTVNKAANSVWQMLEDNNLTMADARKLLAQFGDQGSLADISEGMRVEAAGTAHSNPQAQSTMVDRFGARDAGMEARVEGKLDENFGPYKDPQTIADSVDATKTGANKQLKVLEQYVVDANPVLDEINTQLRTYPKGTPIGDKLLELRRQIIPDQGLPSKDMMDRGHLLQGFKIATRDESEAAYTAGRKEMGRVLKDVSRKANEVLQNSVQDYAEANKAWHGAANVQEQYDFGNKKLLGGDVYPGQANKTWAKLNDFEKEARLQGARAKIEMQTTGKPNPGQRAERILSQNMNDKKVGPMIEARKPGGYQALKGSLEGEQSMRETYDMIAATRGTKTAPVQLAAARRWGKDGAGILPNLVEGAGQAATATAAGGPWFGAASVGAQTAAGTFKYLLSRISNVNPKVVAEAGDILSRMGPEALQSVDTIEKVLKSRGITKSEAAAIAKVVSSGWRSIAPTGQRIIYGPERGGEGR